MLYKDLSYKVIGCCFNVHSGLGPGLLEQCYHNGLFLELKEAGLGVVYNKSYNVLYKGQVVGEYFADLVVEKKIILELKSVKALNDTHKAQLINYLHISGCRAGYLLNFQNEKLEYVRMVI